MDAKLNMPGAWAKVKDVPPSLLPINQNQTLYITKLTSHEEGAPVPQTISGLKSVEEVLDKYKPEENVFLDQEDGGQTQQFFSFLQMGDFTQPGLINQSSLLQAQATKIQDLKKINLHLRSNNMLQRVLKNPESRRVFRAMIEQMLSELS
jgi:hypothetical protein